MDIFTACSNGNLTRVRELIENNVDLNVRYKYWGLTPLMLASEKGNKEICELLIKKGADINSKSDDGFTALFISVSYNSKEICELLIENGADISSKEYNGKTVLYFASIYNLKEICELLIGKGIEFDFEAFEKMIKKGWTELCYTYSYKTSFNRRKHLLACYDSYSY